MAATLACVERWGLGKTSLEDVAREAGLSRATVYRTFPGDRDQVVSETITWEVGRFWARLAERGVPFVLHVGSGPLGIGDAWLHDGRPPTEQFAGAEIIGAKDFAVVHHTAARFLSVLVLDGVLERFPQLRGGAIEMGAGWVPDLLRRLDHAVAIWKRSEPRLAGFARTPSEQAAAQLRFTPYPFEDVGLLARAADPALLLFSSDYPHAEGGREPLRRFEQSLGAAGASTSTVQAFLADNAAGWLGLGHA